MTAPSLTTSPAIAFTNPDRLIRDFSSRGIVILGPEDLGIPAEIHDRIHKRQKQLVKAGERVSAENVPDLLEVINSPGLVAACDRIVGRNWAIVPFSHSATFASGQRDQHWHKDDNGPFNARKQRHHQAVQVEILYYPQDVREDMGPTATIPYSHYWTFNHEENHDNFAGADHLDFDYHISGMERVPVSGPDSEYDEEDIVHRCTEHDVRMREAVANLNWPLVRTYEAAPLRAGSIVIYSHNTFHRGNHRRDDWRTWEENPRFMWRFMLYRTTDPAPGNRSNEEIDWTDGGTDPLTGIDLSEVPEDVTAVWRYHNYWMQTWRPPPPRPETVALEAGGRSKEAERLYDRLLAKGDEAEPVRIGAAYRLAAIGDSALLTKFLGRALHNERKSVRRAATYGLVAVGPNATEVLLKATSSPVKWVRKAGVYGLGDAAPLNEAVLHAVVARLHEDPSVYVRSVAAGSLGCLGRRAIASGDGLELVPDCFDAFVRSLGQEENRPCMSRAQKRSIKFVRPTDECDVCEGFGQDFGCDRFEPVRSAVRENALWSMVILCSHGPAVAGRALEPVISALKEVIKCDPNIFCVGFATDALNRLAHLEGDDHEAVCSPPIAALRAELPKILQTLPMHDWATLARGGYNTLSRRTQSR